MAKIFDCLLLWFFEIARSLLLIILTVDLWTAAILKYLALAERFFTICFASSSKKWPEWGKKRWLKISVSLYCRQTFKRSHNPKSLTPPPTKNAKVEPVFSLEGRACWAEIEVVTVTLYPYIPPPPPSFLPFFIVELLPQAAAAQGTFMTQHFY